MTDTDGYNGWKNYETWAVALWIDNDEGSYHASREVIAEAIDEATERSKVGLAADALESWVEDTMPDLGASMWSDLLNAAFGEVDWYEIAENYLEEIEVAPTQ